MKHAMADGEIDGKDHFCTSSCYENIQDNYEPCEDRMNDATKTHGGRCQAVAHVHGQRARNHEMLDGPRDQKMRQQRRRRERTLQWPLYQGH